MQLLKRNVFIDLFISRVRDKVAFQQVEDSSAYLQVMCICLISVDFPQFHVLQLQRRVHDPPRPSEAAFGDNM